MLLNQKGLKLANKIIKNWMVNKVGYSNLGDFCLRLFIAGNEISFSNTNQHYFRISSISKIITILLILKLEAERKLSLDDEVRKYLPFIKRKITIKDILEHKSGIVRDGGVFDFWSSAVFPDEKDILSLSPDSFKKIKNNFKYSNLGYVLLGMIIEKACGKSYYDCLIEKIAKPLNLDACKDNSVKLKGFSIISGKLINDVAVNAATKVFYPSFGIIISIKSVSRLLSFICDIDKMDDFFGANRRNYFFNSNGNKLEKWKNSGRKIYGHGGDFFGTSADLFIDPKNKIGGIVLSNVRGAELSSISDGLLKIIYIIADSPFFLEKNSFANKEGLYKSRDKNLIVIALGSSILLFDPTDNSPFYNGIIAKKEKEGRIVLKLASPFAEVGEEIWFDKDYLKIGALKYRRISGLINEK